MAENKKTQYQEMLGEEWQWPVVCEVMDAFVGLQEGGEHGLEEKTEEQIRMKIYEWMKFSSPLSLVTASYD